MPTRSSDEYWMQSRRPLACLIFCLPILLAYELGACYLEADADSTPRTGADYWLRQLLSAVGLPQIWVPPLLLVGVLFVWHLAARHPWRISWETPGGMLAESILFAFVLVVIGQTHDVIASAAIAPAEISSGRPVVRLITYLGAGLYEEFVFRLCLLPICLGFFRLSQLSERWSAVLAVLSTSFAFAIAHYVGPGGEPFLLFTFVFRTSAGIFFGTLFQTRGFGITVGAHAAYDLVVGLLMM